MVGYLHCGFTPITKVSSHKLGSTQAAARSSSARRYLINNYDELRFVAKFKL